MTTRLGIVVPCYNEEDVLPETYRRLAELLAHSEQARLVSTDSTIYFVDDEAGDDTWRVIEGLATADSRVVGIKLSRNSGHQKAVLAGLLTARGDGARVDRRRSSYDVDIIEEMVRRFHEGNEIVYGLRKSRSQPHGIQTRNGPGLVLQAAAIDGS